ncbi:E3 ubiquitin-protein ligase CCNP1IP1, partial [Lecanoromycetidae sp. Uapishka_2]
MDFALRCNSLKYMQIDQDRLKNENRDLVAAYREKSRKHQQTQELYDRLKRREMTAATQSAAFDSVDEVLGNVSNQPRFSNPQHNSNINRSQAQRSFLPPHVDHNGIEKVHSHQRSGSANSGGGGGLMPPPPHPRQNGVNGNAFGFANAAQTPSHRTQLGPAAQPAIRTGTAAFRDPPNMVNRSLQSHTPAHRQPFAGHNVNSAARPSMSGYGMSAGMKIGRQQVNPAKAILQTSSFLISPSGRIFNVTMAVVTYRYIYYL